MSTLAAYLTLNESCNFTVYQFTERNRIELWVGGSPGLVVMGGDSCSKGCGFKSQRRILDGHFSHLFVEKMLCLFEKNKRKRGRGWAIFFLKKPELTYGEFGRCN